MLKRIDHIGVVVEDLAEARRFLEALGMEFDRALRVPEKHVEAAFYRCGNCQIELIELTDDEARRKRLGEGARARIEHIAIEVADLPKTLEALQGLGVRTDAPPMRLGSRLNVWTVAETSEGVQYQFLQEDAPTPSS